MASRTRQCLCLLHKAMHDLVALRRQPSQLVPLQPLLRLTQPVAQLHQGANFVGLLPRQQVGYPRRGGWPAQPTNPIGQLAVTLFSGLFGSSVSGGREFVTRQCIQLVGHRLEVHPNSLSPRRQVVHQSRQRHISTVSSGEQCSLLSSQS
jgi:hypothetical protein